MTAASFAQTIPVTELLLLLYYFKMTVPSYPNHFLKVLSLNFVTKAVKCKSISLDKHTSCCAPHSPVSHSKPSILGQVSKSEPWFPCECNGALDD